MYSPTTRLLTVLELLQSHANVTGPQLSEKLEVDVRSVRRYITMLRDLGIPVESEPGRYGAYYLRPGFRLPPLMFTNTEMLAIILGLVAVRHLGLAGALGVESATAKIERVLPEELRERVRAVQGVLTLDIRHPKQPISEEMIARFSLAAYQHNQVWLEYQGYASEKTERVIDIYGLVYHSGFWYAVAHCHLRQALRCFRLDRVKQAKALDTTFEPPSDFDPLAYLLETIARMPYTWRVEVLLRTSLEAARARVSPDIGVLEEIEGGVMLHCYAEGLDWMARFLVSLQCPLVVYHPPDCATNCGVWRSPFCNWRKRRSRDAQMPCCEIAWTPHNRSSLSVAGTRRILHEPRPAAC
jgi:predicted DNA-binding transcriptional regulator YafY